MVKLFVSGFPLEMEEIQLAMLFGLHGDISTIKIVRDKKTRICKGYAFIEMTNRTGAENATEALNGTLVVGKVLTVKINEEPVAVKKPVSSNASQVRPPVYQKVVKPGVEVKKKRPRRAL